MIGVILNTLIIVAVFTYVYKSNEKPREKRRRPAAAQPPFPKPEEMANALMPAEEKRREKKAQAPKGRKTTPDGSPSAQLHGHDRTECPAQQANICRQIKLKKPADARQAFIYSEIFHRKYI